MVKKVNNKKEHAPGGNPPELDETWWEAILVEEEQSNLRHDGNDPRDKSSVTESPQTEAAETLTEIDWQVAEELFGKDIATCLQVTGYNRGGVLVNGDKLRGFVPVSHLLEIPNELEEKEREKALSAYVDKELKIKIIECDKECGRIVFSERAALSESGKRNDLLQYLKKGECVRGIVTNITNFGLFVDLGGVEGLVHVSEMSWGRVSHPADVVGVGDEIEVYVIDIDSERSRVALSLKRMSANPWENAGQRYAPGDVVDAVITSVVPFGAFARLEEGLDGLIHVSEMNDGDESVNPEDVLTEGQRVKVCILQIDTSQQRLGLSLSS